MLQANQEAEDAIALFLLSHEKVVALDSGTQASSKAVNIGLQRYNDGLSDFNRLSNVQLDLARQQDDLAFTRGQIAQGWIDVYRSLGGGWQIRLANAQPFMPGIQQPPTATPSEILPPGEANDDDNSTEDANQSKGETRGPEYANTGSVNPDGQAANSITAAISKKLSRFRERLRPRRAASGPVASELDTTEPRYAAADAVPPPMPHPIQPSPLRTPVLIENYSNTWAPESGKDVYPRALTPSSDQPPPSVAEPVATMQMPLEIASGTTHLPTPDLVGNLARTSNLSSSRSAQQESSQLANGGPSTPTSAEAGNQTQPPAPRRIQISPIKRLARSIRIRSPRRRFEPRRTFASRYDIIGPKQVRHQDH